MATTGLLSTQNQQIPILPWKAKELAPREITPQETVSGQLTGLLNKNNKYLQAARSNAGDMARSRGMINSSLAIGAGEKAAIEAAAPIAGQDASTYAAAGLSAQNANQDLTKQTEGSQQAAERENLQSGYEQSLANLNAGNQIKVENVKAANTLELNKYLQEMGAADTAARLTSQDRNSFTSAVAPLMQQYQTEYSLIQRTPDEQMSPSAKTTAINQLRAAYQPQVNAMAAIYGYQVSWDDWNASSPAAPPPPPPPQQQAGGVSGVFDYALSQSQQQPNTYQNW